MIAHADHIERMKARRRLVDMGAEGHPLYLSDPVEALGRIAKCQQDLLHAQNSLAPTPSAGGAKASTHPEHPLFLAGAGGEHSLINNGMCWEEPDEGMVEPNVGDIYTHPHPETGEPVKYVYVKHVDPERPGYVTFRPRTAWKLAWLLLGVIALLGLIGLVF